MYETFKRSRTTACSPRTARIPTLQSHPLPSERSPSLAELARSVPLGQKTSPHCNCPRHELERKSPAYLNARKRRSAPILCRNEQSCPRAYARCDRDLFHGDLRSAIAQIDGLIQVAPNTRIFYELRGQAISNAAGPAEAIAPFARRSISRITQTLLIECFLLCKLLVATDSKAYTEEADDDSSACGGWHRKRRCPSDLCAT